MPQGFCGVFKYLIPGQSARLGFTLAEVLITIGIIGVVAAMTMPSLVAHYRDKQTVVALKKFYSSMSQALNAAIAKNGETESWGADNFVNSGDSDTGDTPTDDANNKDVERASISPFIKELKLLKDCGRKADGCFTDVKIKRLNGTDDRNIERQTRYYKVILSDGTMLALSGEELAATSNFEIWVDINGSKSPNTLGKDVFMFAIRNNKFEPYSTVSTGDMVEICSPFQNKDGASRGYNCANWVLHNENLDYLYCADLNWQTKTKCK